LKSHKFCTRVVFILALNRLFWCSFLYFTTRIYIDCYFSLHLHRWCCELSVTYVTFITKEIWGLILLQFACECCYHLPCFEQQNWAYEFTFLSACLCVYITFIVSRLMEYKDAYEITLSTVWSSGQSSWLQNGDVLCFLWGTNWIYIRVCYVEKSRPPLWSSGQSSWLQNGDLLCFLWGTN
jgi:hypothetical protein